MTSLAELRHLLHSHAEVGLDLPETQAILLDALAGLGLDIRLGAGLSSVTAVLRGGRPGPVVLLRADMDALPLTEETGLPIAADRPAMHACGHDMHMTGLVGAARLLAERRDELPGSVVFMFQPGEEGAGGARIMLEEGVLDAAGERPVAAYALHVDSKLAAGVRRTRPESIMAGSNILDLRVNGAGGHAALPHTGVDPVPVAAEIVLAIQSFVTRRVPAHDPAIVSVTRLQTNSQARNVMPSTVEIDVNVRTLSRETLALVRDDLTAMLAAIGAAHGCTVDAEFVEAYPVTYNDPAETEAVIELLGADRLPASGMASEDFAYVLDQVPGTLLFVGACPPGVDPATGPAMHSAAVAFDDGVLDLMASTFRDLAVHRLERGTVH
ncbi:M20 metallopeptidase family protein [Paractinoplanes toevensis]|uniref:Hippurate hydrolase n=1 Tax=Paractinoplanes toevensis TaxID=571911 RepID=A0A919TAT9_9ACTN|nr:M20 family metallopeptidase [Actinoplanes toevensis]GIM90839.1 hippurate hydrolase [Actinoplanes toevensis]